MEGDDIPNLDYLKKLVADFPVTMDAVDGKQNNDLEGLELLASTSFLTKGEGQMTVCESCQLVIPSDEKPAECISCRLHQHIVPSDDIGKELEWKCNECNLLDFLNSIDETLELEKIKNESSNNQEPVLQDDVEIESTTEEVPTFLLSECDIINCQSQTKENDSGVERVKEEFIGNDGNINFSSEAKCFFFEDKITKIRYVSLQWSNIIGNPKLCDSLGYSYGLRNVCKNGTIVWQCVRCNGRNGCRTSLTQIRDQFEIKRPHTHEGDYSKYLEALEKKAKEKTPTLLTSSILLSLKRHTPQTFWSRRPSCMKPKEENKVKLKDKKGLSLIMKTQSSTSVVHTTPLYSNNGIRSPKSAYIIIKGTGQPTCKLLDQYQGYTYYLLKSGERTNVWICSKSETNYKCTATVKQVGNYFIRSTSKHTHLSSLKGLFGPKAVIRKRTKANKEKVCGEKAVGSSPVILFNLKNENCPEYQNSKDKLKKEGSRCKGVKGYLSEEEKSGLIKVFTSIMNTGYPMKSTSALNRNILKVFIEGCKSYFDGHNLYIFHQNRPSSVWVKSFLQSHDVLRERLSYASELSYSSLKSDKLRWFYTSFSAALKENYRLEAPKFMIPKNAARIFSCDSIQLPINLTNEYAKGDEDRSKRFQTTMTVLCCINCAGLTIPPLIINKGETVITYSDQEDFEEKYETAVTEDGRLNIETFYHWLQSFDKYLAKLHIRRPVVLVLNGDHVHIDYESIQFVYNRNIFLYYVPPYCAKVLSPINVSLFARLEEAFPRKFTEMKKKVLPRKFFPTNFFTAFRDLDVPALIQRGFVTTGLCPYNSDKTSDSRSINGDNEDDSPNLGVIRKRGRPPKGKHPRIQPGNAKIYSLQNKVASRGKKRLSSPKKSQLCKKMKFGPSLSAQEIQSSEEPYDDPPADSELDVSSLQKVKLDIKDEQLSSATDIKLEEDELNLKLEPSFSSEDATGKWDSNFNSGNFGPSINGFTEDYEGLVSTSGLDGYKMALKKVNGIFDSIVEPSILKEYKEKLLYDSAYPDVTFLIWREVQKIKSVVDLL